MKWKQILASDTGLNLLQTLARSLFALLAVLYFLHADPQHAPQPLMCWLFFVVYVVVQLALLGWRSTTRRVLANLVDLIAVTGLVVLDPQHTPPTLLFFLVLPLSSGVLFGLKSFISVLIATVVVVPLALVLHHAYFELTTINGSLFLAVTLLLCALYFLALLARNRVLQHNAEAAAWHNPSTGLITKKALISTAGWLVPLHDRLATPLTIALLSPANDASLKDIATLLTERIRRSDIAGHFDSSLALLLPSTNMGEAEQLLTELHDSQAGGMFNVSVITFNGETPALEPILLHLQHSLARLAHHDHALWLSHAPQMRM